MGLFTKQPYDEFILEKIADCDQQIKKNKDRIKKYGNNSLTINAFKSNINRWEKQRSNLQKDLDGYRREQQNNKGVSQ